MLYIILFFLTFSVFSYKLPAEVDRFFNDPFRYVGKLPLPDSIRTLPVYHEYALQFKDWSCGYNVLFNAANYENRFGLDQPHCDPANFIKTCNPFITNNNLTPNNGLTFDNIMDLAYELNLSTLTCLKLTDKDEIEYVCPRSVTTIISIDPSDDIKQLQLDAKKRYSVKKLKELKKHLLNASHKPAVLHFACLIELGKETHVILMTVLKNRHGQRKIFIKDNLNQMILEDSQAKKYVDYLKLNFDIKNTYVLSRRTNRKSSNDKPIAVMDKIIKEENEYSSLEIHYPQLENGPSEVCEDIEKLIQSELKSFRKASLEIWDNNQPEIINDRKDGWERAGSSNLEITYKIVHANDCYLSLVFHISYYYGFSAHPGHDWISFNWDVKKGKYILLKALFPSKFKFREKISKLSRKKIEEIAMPPSEPGWMDDNRETDPLKGSFSTFTFNDDVINLYFDWPWFHLGELSISRADIK